MTGNATHLLKSSEIFVDENADWFHRGNRIFRPEVLETLYSMLDVLDSGQFVLVEGEEVCLLDVADTPYVVSRVDRKENPPGEESIRIGLKNLQIEEDLDPSTLQVGKDNVLHCRVIDGRFRARFSRPAYYQLAQFIQEDPSGFYIELNGRKYFVG